MKYKRDEIVRVVFDGQEEFPARIIMDWQYATGREFTIRPLTIASCDLRVPESFLHPMDGMLATWDCDWDFIAILEEI